MRDERVDAVIDTLQSRDDLSERLAKRRGLVEMGRVGFLRRSGIGNNGPETIFGPADIHPEGFGKVRQSGDQGGHFSASFGGRGDGGLEPGIREVHFGGG